MLSRLVQSPQIVRLLDDETGVTLSALDLVGSDQTEVLRLYKRLHLSRASGEGRILCELCGVPVYLCGMPDKQHYYFKHYREDGSCPATTRGNLTEDEINALRYQGQRESKRHIRLKMLLAESLRQDAAFSDPVVEGTWRAKEGKNLRRPDVRSQYQSRIDVAFEVQLSTTFGRVMAERELFYKQDGALLLWVFGEFEFENARLMMQVVFANNNRNAFVVNETTLEASITERRLMLECRWLQPSLRNSSLVWTPSRRLVGFDELTIDLIGQRAFYVDTDQLEADLLQELEGPSISEEIEEFWLDYERFAGRERPDVPALNRKWEELGRRARQAGWALPSRHDEDFRSLLRALYSAKLGASVGWSYNSLWGVAHGIHDFLKGFLWIFLPALEHYGRLRHLEAQDRNGRWAKKMDDWKRGAAAAAPAYGQDHRFNDAIRNAFPDLTHLVPEHRHGH